MKKNKKYTSLHQFLDEVFAQENNPSKERIEKAKKEYWKLWFREYHRQRRKKRKEYTLGFDTDTLNRISEHKGNQTVSQFLYSAVEHYLTTPPPQIQTKEQFILLQQESMKIIHKLEEIIDTETYEALEQLITSLESLEKDITKLYSTP